MKSAIKVHSKTPPVVELDSSAHAAYVRFSKRKVERTEVVECKAALVTIDYDRDNGVVGVELVGVNEFKIDALLEKANVMIPERMRRDTSYRPVESAPELACA